MDQFINNVERKHEQKMPARCVGFNRSSCYANHRKQNPPRCTTMSDFSSPHRRVASCARTTYKPSCPFCLYFLFAPTDKKLTYSEDTWFCGRTPNRIYPTRTGGAPGPFCTPKEGPCRVAQGQTKKGRHQNCRQGREQQKQKS